MVKTKQTQHGGSSTRPAGMQVATHGDALEADQDIPEEDWPDMDNPFRTAAAQQAAQTSKSSGETGEGSKAVGTPPLTIHHNPRPAPVQVTPRTPPQSPHHNHHNHQQPLTIHHNPNPVPAQLTPRTPPKILKRKKIKPL